MKKGGKVILIIVAVSVLAYGLFVTADCIRLSKLSREQKGAKPIITISEDTENHVYKGLGYSISYNVNEGDKVENAYGAGIRLFGKFLVYAYIEDKAEVPNGNEEAPNLESEDEQNVCGALVPMVMVDGKLYLDTGFVEEVLKCGTPDGIIKSSVEANKRPTENNQSNFGKDINYQRRTGGTISVCMKDKWCIFAEESVRSKLIEKVNTCKKYLDEKLPNEEVTNYDSPSVRVTELPESYASLTDGKKAKAGEPCLEVMFNTKHDGVLGPIVFYVLEDGTVEGMAVRQ